MVPPDAPESKPELAAKPVEGFSPVPAPKRLMHVEPEAQAPAASPPAPVAVESEPTVKRGPGRPKGAKNKPKDELAGQWVVPAGVPTPVNVAPRPLTYKTIRHTEAVTINLGNYNSARVEVTIEADVGDTDLDEAFAQVKHQVQKQLEMEGEKYEALVQPDNKGKK